LTERLADLNERYRAGGLLLIMQGWYIASTYPALAFGQRRPWSVNRAMEVVFSASGEVKGKTDSWREASRMRPSVWRDRALIDTLAAHAATASHKYRVDDQIIDGEKRALAWTMAGGIAHEIKQLAVSAAWSRPAPGGDHETTSTWIHREPAKVLKPSSRCLAN
jgi:hypothetical protein